MVGTLPFGVGGPYVRYFSVTIYIGSYFYTLLNTPVTFHFQHVGNELLNDTWAQFGDMIRTR